MTRQIALLASLGLVLATGAAASASTPVPSFAAKKSYSAGRGLTSLVGVADLNGDGAPDAATLEGGRLSVFLNKGDGAFLPRSDYQAGSAVDESALADLNGDGRPDVVTVNRGRSGTHGTLSILLNRGDGSFAPRRDISLGTDTSPQTLAIADLNLDGRPDVIDAHGDVVSVFLGNGGGTFQPEQDYGINGAEVDGERSLGVADLNGDGKPDLVVAGGNYIFVFFGNGDGSFQAAHRYNRVGDSVALVDLNGDGRPDLVTWISLCCVPVAVSLNRGDGSFGPPREYLAGGAFVPGGPDQVRIADLNGDGKPDLVARDEDAGSGDEIGFSVLFNRGDGTFGSRSDYRTDDLTSMAIGDVNGDGRPDLVVVDDHVNFGGFDELFLNKGQRRFEVRRAYPADLLPGDIAIADLNGDGRPDFLTTTYFLTPGKTGFSVLLSKPGLCNVQNVHGLTAAAAKWRLARVNCGAAIRRVYEPTRRSPKGGVVIDQKPKFGAVLRAGGKVRLTVRFGRRG